MKVETCDNWYIPLTIINLFPASCKGFFFGKGNWLIRKSQTFFGGKSLNFFWNMFLLNQVSMGFDTILSTQIVTFFIQGTMFYVLFFYEKKTNTEYLTQVPIWQALLLFFFSRWRRWTMHWPRKIGKRQFFPTKIWIMRSVGESTEHDTNFLRGKFKPCLPPRCNFFFGGGESRSLNMKR